MQNRRRLVGAAAGCAVAIATLMGAPVASAQPPECIGCEPNQPPAFGKREAHGAPERAFGKIEASEGAFLKIPHGAENPGGTENVFIKDPH
jgi:hypothetical protein